jgi:hypothetical protein
METLSMATIFWLLVLGATTGWVVGNIVGHEGITVRANIIWGMVGAVTIGVMGFWLQLSGVLLYAFMGTLATLFLANVFHLHHVEDVLTDTRHSIHIKKSKKRLK